jgi:hypothetical protein
VGIASDEDAERLLGDDPHTDGAEVSETEEAILSLYELTTWLQEHITQFMLDGLPDVDGEDPVDGDDDLGDPGDDDPAGDDEDAHGAGGVDPRGPDDPRGDRG